ncbi:radical SAM protein [Myxococcota bacterium]|nr:radical SAM protein [Myxococcota bacterium]
MTAPAVLLVSPGVLRAADLDFGLPHLVSLGGYLRQQLRVRVEIVDLCWEGGDPEHLSRVLTGLGPFQVVGLSCYSSFDLLRCLAVGRFLKRLFPGVTLVAGGYHASALPDDLLFDGSPFDAVIAGEGERPFARLVETVLGGGRPDPRPPRDLPEHLDDLPPYDWSLLDRYWPRAHELGRKLQVYLSRGCPYHCTFCMERAKSGYAWRAFSPARAVDELVRLSKFTDLGRWVVNLADPLFGWQRAWRREVLEGILRAGLAPRQFWTLTRADDLQSEDVELLARARFSIGIGLESGSPTMLGIMQKGNTPEKYLAALERLMDESRRFGLNWAANIIVGHPGETPETMVETRDFLRRLYSRAAETSGWLSVDPFRLYPGALVHEQMAEWSQRYGTRFHHPTWWKSWYDGAFRAQHVDPSASLSYEARVRFMYDTYGPLVRDIAARFRGQGRSVDRVFERSVAEQVDLLSPQQRDVHLSRAAAARGPSETDAALGLAFPLGLNLRDPRTQAREAAVRRLLEAGVLRSAVVVEALLAVNPADTLKDDDVALLLGERPATPGMLGPEGPVPRVLPVRIVALALEALGLTAGDRAVDLAASTGYVAALMRHLVGPSGEVVVTSGDPTRPRGLTGLFDGLFLGGAVPAFPAGLTGLLQPEGGRAVTFIGPRFRPQDMVCLTRRATGAGTEAGGAEPGALGGLQERLLAVVAVPALRGVAGWLRTPPAGP